MTEPLDVHWAAKIATLEEQMRTTSSKLEDMTKNMEVLETQIDKLLSLLSQGKGAVWVVSGILGTGLFGLASVVMGWFK